MCWKQGGFVSAHRHFTTLSLQAMDSLLLHIPRILYTPFTSTYLLAFAVGRHSTASGNNEKAIAL